MKLSKDFLKVQKFLTKNKMNRILLCERLQISSTLTIDNWLRNRALPSRKRDDILAAVRLLKEVA